MSSILQSQLEELFLEWFGWFTRDVAAFLFLGAAALLILLGIGFAFVRPRGIGFFVLLGSGLLTTLNTWLWYALPYIERGHGRVLAVVVIFNLGMALATSIAAKKPTAKECGVSAGLSVISLGIMLYTLWHSLLSTVIYYATVSTIVQLALPPLILLGTAAILTGSVMAVVGRSKADPLPRKIDLP